MCIMWGTCFQKGVGQSREERCVALNVVFFSYKIFYTNYEILSIKWKLNFKLTASSKTFDTGCSKTFPKFFVDTLSLQQPHTRVKLLSCEDKSLNTLSVVSLALYPFIPF